MPLRYVSDPGPAGPPVIKIQYQPDECFWEFQFIETAIFAGLALILIALTYQVVAHVRR